MPIRHVVAFGEGVDSLAYRYGFFPLTIWEFSDNAALRAERDDRNILLEGDVVIVPDKRLKSVAAATGTRHVFRRRGVPAVFRLQALREGKPRAELDYTLDVDGVAHTGRTDSNGVLEVYVPPDSIQAVLTLGTDAPVVIRLGGLDPVSTIRGVQQRLNNLGFACGGAGGELDDETVEALRRFQSGAGIEATGELDDTTRGKLREVHDSQE